MLGAGDWQVLASIDSAPVIWGATNRPSVDLPDVIASYAVFDPNACTQHCSTARS